MRKAFRTATADGPGPVHITTAANVLTADASDADIRLPRSPLRLKSARPSPSPVRRRDRPNYSTARVAH